MSDSQAGYTGAPAAPQQSSQFVKAQAFGNCYWEGMRLDKGLALHDSDPVSQAIMDIAQDNPNHEFTVTFRVTMADPAARKPRTVVVNGKEYTVGARQAPVAVSAVAPAVQAVATPAPAVAPVAAPVADDDIPF